MLLVATGLIVLGGVTALFGQQLFRILLPIVGFVVGAMVGFGGVQAVFGKGVISITIALLMAIIVGLVMALLSFAFFDLAVTILVVLLGASVFSYLGVAIGLQDNGFILFLLGLAGGVLGLVWAISTPLSIEFVIGATALLGVAMIMSGVLLFAGEVSLDQLDEQGVIGTVTETVDQSFLWLFVWIAGSIVAVRAQVAAASREMLPAGFEYKPKKTSK